MVSRYQGWIPTLKYDILSSCASLKRTTEIDPGFKDTVKTIMQVANRRLEKSKSSVRKEEQSTYCFEEFSEELREPLERCDYDTFSVSIHHSDVCEPPIIAFALAKKDVDKKIVVKRVLICEIDESGVLNRLAAFDIESVLDNGIFSMTTECATDDKILPNLAYEAIKYLYHRHKYHEAGGARSGDALLELIESTDGQKSDLEIVKLVLENYVHKFENYKLAVWAVSKSHQLPRVLSLAKGEMVFAKSLSENVLCSQPNCKKLSEDYMDRFDYLSEMIECSYDERRMLFDDLHSTFQNFQTILLGMYGVAATFLTLHVQAHPVYVFAALALLISSTQTAYYVVRRKKIITNKKMGEYDPGYSRRK